VKPIGLINGVAVDALVGGTAQGIILGCTEIRLLIEDEDTEVPLYDTTRLHARTGEAT
jgi:amino-acid racemase